MEEFELMYIHPPIPKRVWAGIGGLGVAAVLELSAALVTEANTMIASMITPHLHEVTYRLPGAPILAGLGVWAGLASVMIGASSLMSEAISTDRLMDDQGQSAPIPSNPN